MKFADALKPLAADDREVWSTAKVDKVVHAMEQGYNVKNPFYEGKQEWRQGNIVFEYTQHELDEIRKCARDIVYFANTYCYVMTDDGYQKIVLRDYQVDTLRTYQRDRFVIFLSARQTGKTIVTGIFLTWFMLFHFDKNTMLVSNKGETSKEIITKIKAIMEGLPFFMKPGVIKKDVMSMVFDNRCTILASTTTKKTGIGFTIHLLFMDEFAHVLPNIKDQFYHNIFPTLSSSKISRIIITSTPNGRELFHTLYSDAIATPKRNTYTAIKVDWWQVPGRDDAWKKEQIANLGSEEAFNEQYGCSFDMSSSLLLGAAELNRLKECAREYTVKEFDAFNDLRLDYSAFRWDPTFDESLLRDPKEHFLVTLDLAEGVGRDYSVINVFRLAPIPQADMEKVTSPGSVMEYFGVQQVGVFRHNKYAVEDVAKMLYVLMVKVLNPDNVRLVMEANIYGNEMVKDLLGIYPSDNQFDEGTIVKFKHRLEAKDRKFGFKFNEASKKVYCEKTRRLISTGRLVVTDKKTADEFQFFSRRTNGTYSATVGNDDLCMSVVLASTFFDTLDYSESVLEAADGVDSERLKYIEDAVDGVDSFAGEADAGFGAEGPPIDIDKDFLDMF